MNYIRQGAWGILESPWDDPRMIVTALHQELELYGYAYWHDYKGHFVLWKSGEHMRAGTFETLEAMCWHALKLIHELPSDEDSANPNRVAL